MNNMTREFSHDGAISPLFIGVFKKMFRLSEACFCQHNPVLTECTPIDARGRDRYRYRNRDRTGSLKIDTDSDPDSDTDNSDTLVFVYRLSIGTDS